MNEITGITTTSGTGWAVPAYDAGGNMTTLPQPGALNSSYAGKYDAWHRLVELKAGETVVGTYRYDGAHRRVSKLVGSDTTHFYYSKQWQILEERLNASSSAARQFVWGLRYIDDLILRDQGGTRHYVLHDFFNVTAIVNTSGTVQERYGYNAYGECRVMTSSFGNRSSSSYNWETRYGAYRWDAESELYQVRHRYLHPLLGVWLSRDPLGEEDGVNLYGYVKNGAINFIDKSGLIKVVDGPKEVKDPHTTCCLEKMKYYQSLGGSLADCVEKCLFDVYADPFYGGCSTVLGAIAVLLPLRFSRGTGVGASGYGIYVFTASYAGCPDACLKCECTKWGFPNGPFERAGSWWNLCKSETYYICPQFRYHIR